jgi:hypothetical protein
MANVSERLRDGTRGTIGPEVEERAAVVLMRRWGQRVPAAMGYVIAAAR